MALKPQICVTGKLVVCTTIRKRDAGRGLVLEGGGSVGPRHAAFELVRSVQVDVPMHQLAQQVRI